METLKALLSKLQILGLNKYESRQETGWQRGRNYATTRLSVPFVVLKMAKIHSDKFFFSWAGVLVAENRRGERQGEIFLLNRKRAGTHQDRTAATSPSCPRPLGGWSRSAEAEPALRAERLAARPTPGESS